MTIATIKFRGAGKTGIKSAEVVQTGRSFFAKFHHPAGDCTRLPLQGPAERAVKEARGIAMYVNDHDDE